VIHGGADNDFIGRAWRRSTSCIGDTGDATIHWDYATLSSVTVDWRHGYDKLGHRRPQGARRLPHQFSGPATASRVANGAAGAR
jgi:hypothetical protein